MIVRSSKQHKNVPLYLVPKLANVTLTVSHT